MVEARDEGALLRAALTRAGLEATFEGAAASVSCAIPGVPGAITFRIDAPEGWLRMATTLGASTPDAVTRANLSLAYLETGLAHVHVDDAQGLVRVAASLPALEDAPIGAAVNATLAHLARVRHKLATGDGEIRAVTDDDPPGTPELAVAAEVIGRTLALVPERAAYVGGLREPRSGVECAFRLHQPAPGIFAFDAWGLPPARRQPEPSLFERIDAFNVGQPAGAMMLLPGAGLLVYRWACPLRFLDLDELVKPVLATTALEAFMRWRAAGA